NVGAARFHPIAVMLYRKVCRPVIAQARGHLETRWLESALAGQDANIFHPFIARQTVDVRDDLVFFSSGFDECPSAITDFGQGAARASESGKFSVAFLKPHPLKQGVIGLPFNVGQRAL